MTLGKRAFFLIFPVVLASYLVAALTVYIAQGQSVLGLERARLIKQLDHLGAVFDAEVSESRVFLISLLESNAIRLFVAESNESYRSNALGVRLQENIKALSEDPKKFVSFTILRSSLNVDYYFENSEDPFAEISPQQMALAKSLYEGSQLRDWTYLHEPGSRPLIVYSEFVDPTTFGRPLPTAKKNAVLIQSAVEPEQFLARQHTLEAEYGAGVQITAAPPRGSPGLYAGVQLAPSLYAGIIPREGYFAGTRFQEKMVLGVGALFMSLFSIGVIITLIRRFVTNPVAELDLQVTSVMEGKRNGIADSGAGGEIGRLTSNIKKLYDQSLAALTLVRQSSFTDTLTGIGNRAHFNSIASALVDKAIASGERCSVLFIDIDNFKFVNDRYGHEVGDALLRTLAVRLSETVHQITTVRGLPDALLARLAGDEFAVLVHSKPGDKTLQVMSNAIIDLFYGGLEVAGKRYPVTASIGVAICPEDATTITELVANADAAMYQAKTSGKNRSARFSRALADKRDRVRHVQEELRLMNPDEQFRLVYMPIVDTHGHVKGCEALLRWQSPTLGNVTPDEFVPIAESTGLFTKIDWWVINKAMTDLTHLQAMFGAETILAINISSAELHSRSICDYLATCLERYAISPRSIEIELTETYAVKLGDQLHSNIETLRAMGLRISIDDFGAGYTSIKQIIEYTADTIKLDRELVQNLTQEKLHSALKAVIALCHAQDMSVIGEGVDTPEKLATLTAAGCDLFQGYLISKPLDLHGLAAWAQARIALGPTSVMQDMSFERMTTAALKRTPRIARL